MRAIWSALLVGGCAASAYILYTRVLRESRKDDRKYLFDNFVRDIDEIRIEGEEESILLETVDDEDNEVKEDQTQQQIPQKTWQAEEKEEEAEEREVKGDEPLEDGTDKEELEISENPDHESVKEEIVCIAICDESNLKQKKDLEHDESRSVLTSENSPFITESTEGSARKGDQGPNATQNHWWGTSDILASTSWEEETAKEEEENLAMELSKKQSEENSLKLKIENEEKKDVVSRIEHRNALEREQIEIFISILIHLSVSPIV